MSEVEKSKNGSSVFLSFDPGLNYFGGSVNEVTKDKFKVIEAILVNNNRALKGEEKEQEKIHGQRTVKIMNIIKQIEELIEKYNVNKLVIEAPFYHSSTPAAYGSLLEVIFAIKYRVVYERELEMILVAPTVIKKLFSGKGNASKAVMKEFLRAKFTSGAIDTSYEMDELSEHEIDAIAVGFTHWIENREEL